jgi:hypothetical protein
VDHLFNEVVQSANVIDGLPFEITASRVRIPKPSPFGIEGAVGSHDEDAVFLTEFGELEDIECKFPGCAKAMKKQ